VSTPILQVRDFTVEFWVDGVWYPAAINMNFDVRAGETLAIVANPDRENLQQPWG